MKETQKNAKRQLWRGITTVTAAVLTLSLSVSMIIDIFRTDIDKFLGTKSSKIVTVSTENEDLYTFKSDYSSTSELLNSIEDLGERMNEEGTVLLKNNGALPLSQDETKKVTLLGFSSYYPVRGGDMGSSLTENKGTDADTVNLVEAFTAKGYEFNPVVKAMYDGLRDDIKSEAVMPWGQVIPYFRAVAPSTTGVFTSMEPSQDKLSSTEPNWKSELDKYNVMIVTIARAAGENANYTPGEAGISSDQNLNQKDPLGLSDSERDVINTAIAAKKLSKGKVIILLNNSSAMEIEELKNNTDIDAILEIGLPGGYGFYGVADILSGDANPSGKLADTYAVKNQNSPAAQNYGNYQYTNADSNYSINSTLVEAESIYTGYKYYETRFADSILGQGNADSMVGSSTGSSWSYDSEVSYPFGFGLSYTTFSQILENVTVDLKNKTVSAEITVTNTGKVAGKDVVQLYVSTPYTSYNKAKLIEKSAIQLLDYEKN